MPRSTPVAHLAEAMRASRQRLLSLRCDAGHWRGRLSSSALSTATAVTALAVIDAERHRGLIAAGLRWLAQNQNDDGGWGDTVLSKSNISTTLLSWSAFAAGGAAGGSQPAQAAAQRWLAREAGSAEPDALAGAVVRRYGRDRTFSVPILTMCAIAGRWGRPRAAWGRVPALPFELAACPARWFRALRMPVVSYALPALIAMGVARFRNRPPRNPILRGIRRLAEQRALRVLHRIQPRGGGFLEAAPLTSFVAMSLAAAGLAGHPVVGRAVDFLVRSARADGSWPIDTDLATWVTTLSVNAFAASEAGPDGLEPPDRQRVRRWLLDQQYRARHPYTQAAPGGWAWTDLPGGVPDADDTPGALLALRRLGAIDAECCRAAAAGAAWLAGLQNADGGMPTFCRGWGRLPFDRSAADLTAHALRAWSAWRGDLPAALRRRVGSASRRSLSFLKRTQAADGSWRPLWFGNEHAPDDANPTYGTSRVVLALAETSRARGAGGEGLLSRGAGWLAGAQHDDGGWGGDVGVPASIEETALAVEALAAARQALRASPLEDAVARGAAWLIEHTDAGRRFPPSPIGFYFAKLWYFEALYPVIFTAAALGRAQAALLGR